MSEQDTAPRWESPPAGSSGSADGWSQNGARDGSRGGLVQPLSSANPWPPPRQQGQQQQQALRGRGRGRGHGHPLGRGSRPKYNPPDIPAAVMQQYWQEGRQTALFTLSQNEADNTAKLADVESWDTPEHRRRFITVKQYTLNEFVKHISTLSMENSALQAQVTELQDQVASPQDSQLVQAAAALAALQASHQALFADLEKTRNEKASLQAKVLRAQTALADD